MLPSRFGPAEEETGQVKRRVGIVFVAVALALGPAAVSRVVAGSPGIAHDDFYEVFEDNELQVAAPGIVENDDTHQLPGCVVSTNDAGLDGSVDVNANGGFTFTPSDDFNGETSFTYMGAFVENGSCATQHAAGPATVHLTVKAVNDPPFVSTDQCAVDIEVAEDSGAFDGAPHCVQMQDSGPLFGPGAESDHFQAWIVNTNKPALFASGPTITLDGEDPHVPAYGRLTFTPAANANGTATVNVRGRDDGGTANGGDDTSGPTSFKIRITPVNDAPTANTDSFTAIPDRTLNVKKPGVLKNDSDIDGDELTAQTVDEPSHGIVNLNANGAFSYTPDAGYVGPDAFSYRASDGDEVSATRVVTLNVTAVPTPVPTTAPPTGAPPTGEPSAEPSPSASVEPSGSIEPSASPSLAPSPSASLEPGATPAPDPSGASAGLPLPILIVSLLLIALLAFGAAVFVPKWIESRRTGGGGGVGGAGGSAGGGYGGTG